MNGLCRAGGMNEEWNKNLPVEKFKRINMNDGKFEVIGLENEQHLCLSTLFIKRPNNVA